MPCGNGSIMPCGNGRRYHSITTLRVPPVVGFDTLTCTLLPTDALPLPTTKHHAHGRHNVWPVTRGLRRVLVIELWEGVERACGHRCELAEGPCSVRSVIMYDWCCA